jgi:hypothetical protein
LWALAACDRPAPPVAVAPPDRDAGVVWLAADASLPALASGYELYAWQGDAGLTFTLLSFRDSANSEDELTSTLPAHQNGSFVRVHGQGVALLEATLARIPRTASVILESYPRLPALSADSQAAVLRLLLARGSSDAGAESVASRLCTRTGGSVQSSYCCMTSHAFPNTCSVGACGCAPEHSKLSPYCVCAEGLCFDEAVGCTPRLRTDR